jgi:hypothetical protein
MIKAWGSPEKAREVVYRSYNNVIEDAILGHPKDRP